ncbi:MAG: hypothetical protein WAT27_09020 [Chitinophagales bacterium]|nr:hypothetical protein [Saprospiraceae bacterium]
MIISNQLDQIRLTAELILNNGYYYKSYSNGPNGGICPYGGSFDGANCYLGPVPSGYEGKAFVYNNCYYVAPKCP